MFHLERRYFWLFFVLVVGLFLVIQVFLRLQFVRKSRADPPVSPHILSREEWGARAISLVAPEEYGLFDPQANPEGVLYYSGELQQVLNTIVVHHSALSNAGPDEIQALHMDKRGFADVAYHFMIDSTGQIFEGRPIGVRGAHVQDYNTGSVGIVLLGNYNEEYPTDEQITSLRDLVDYLRYTYAIRYLVGHRDYPDQSPVGTECPGDHVYPLLPGLAKELGMKSSIKGYVQPDWAE